jgi:glycosyltransferase involved in cell wall biosynthesis
MRIAQVAPLYESVPPKLYGGTERVVSYLTEALVRQGHDVTLFASGDSSTSARLVASCRKSLRLDPNCCDTVAPHFVMLEEVARRAAEFDVIHFHVDYLHFPFSRRHPVPHVTTLHGRLDISELVSLYREYVETPLISISNAQRVPLGSANWRATVYHGLPSDLLRPGTGRGGYLAFLGRISPEKGPERAIAIARSAGIPLKIAAKVDQADRAYFETVIRPMIHGPLVDFVGEIGEAEKQEFLGEALALLFPIDWPEPFGLVMIESLACGTPVIAFRRGSVPEVLDAGVTGFVVDDVREAVAAVTRLSELRRSTCRAVFDRRFTAARMAEDYVTVYQTVARWQARARERLTA